MVCDGSKSFKIAAKGPISSHRVAGPIGQATRCDAAIPQRNVLQPLRCIKIPCDARRCIFQHVGNSALDFGISQLFTTRFSNGLHHNAGNLMSFPVMCVSKRKHAIVSSRLATTFQGDTCNGLRCSASESQQNGPIVWPGL